MANLAGVKSSSHNSTPIHVSSVLITASPNGTLVCKKVMGSMFEDILISANLFGDCLNDPR
jgi:hypothetical protein